MISAEVKRIWQVPVFRLWLMAAAVCMLMECGGILLQYHGLIFNDAYGAETFRQTEYEGTYLLRIEDKLDQLHSQKDSVLFSDPQTQLILSKEIENTEALRIAETSLQHPDIFKRILSLTPFWSVLYLLTGILMSYELFIQDDEAGMAGLYASTSQSRLRRAVSKLIVLIAFPMLIALLKTGLEHLLLSFCGISGRLPVQAVNGFFSSGIRSDIAGYINLVNIRSFLGVMLSVLLFVFLYFVFRSWNISAGLLLLIMIAEYLAFTFVSEASALAFLKHFNIYAAMFSSSLHIGYLPVFSLLLSETALVMAILAVLCLAVSFLAVENYEKQAGVRRLGIRKKHLRSPRTMTGFHIREILIAKKGIIILGLLSVFCMGNALRMDAIRTADELRYETFRKQYYGEIDDQLIQKIETDRQIILDALKERDEYLTHLETLTDQQREKLEELISLTSQTENMERLYQEVNELHNAGAHYFSDHAGIQYLMRKDDISGSVMDFLTCILPVGFLAITVMTAERRGIKAKLTDSSASGRKTVLCSYAKILSSLLIMAMMIVYGFQAIRVGNGYPLELSGTVNEAVGIQSEMPVWLYVLLHYLNIILLANALLLAAEVISVRLSLAPSLIIWLMITACILLIPFVSGYIGFSFAGHFYGSCIFSLFLIGIMGVCIKYL